MKWSYLILAALVGLAGPACNRKGDSQDASGDESAGASLVLATTTSTYDTGLLDELIPDFEAAQHLQVKVVAVGTGEALELGRRGVADVLLVHAPPAEMELVEEGHAIDRHPVMWNDFVLAGPAGDPAGVRGADAVEALKTIAEKKATFVSRGDDSGTHKKERALWKEMSREPGGWGGYLETGQGMAFTLRVADEKQGYVLTDRGTYLAVSDSIDLDVIVEGDARLTNPYHIMRVSPQMHPKTHTEGAKALIEYFLAEETQKRIGEFGREKYGQQLFHPGPVPES